MSTSSSTTNIEGCARTWPFPAGAASIGNLPYPVRRLNSVKLRWFHLSLRISRRSYRQVHARSKKAIKLEFAYSEIEFQSIANASSSMGRTIPTRQDRIVMPQQNISVRIFLGRSMVSSKSYAAAGCDGKYLLDRLFR
ncbi:MAG: hypothetical protein ABWZ19_08505 [Hyphomicrobium sp.]